MRRGACLLDPGFGYVSCESLCRKNTIKETLTSKKMRLLNRVPQLVQSTNIHRKGRMITADIRTTTIPVGVDLLCLSHQTAAFSRFTKGPSELQLAIAEQELSCEQSYPKSLSAPKGF